MFLFLLTEASLQVNERGKVSVQFPVVGIQSGLEQGRAIKWLSQGYGKLIEKEPNRNCRTKTGTYTESLHPRNAKIASLQGTELQTKVYVTLHFRLSVL